MIAKREKWLAPKRAKHHKVISLTEPHDPGNADEALLLLGIAELDSGWDHAEGRRRLRLRPWAVQLALSRGRRRLSPGEISAIERCTRDAGTLRWPAGARDERDG